MLKNDISPSQSFMQKHPHFLWWMKDVTTVDENGIVEATLTWGTMEDKKELLRILGRSTFRKNFEMIANGRRRQNLEPRTIAYWSTYLSK